MVISKNFWFRVDGDREGVNAGGLPVVPVEGLVPNAGLPPPLAFPPPLPSGLSDLGVPLPDVPGLRETGDPDRSEAGRRDATGDGDAGDGDGNLVRYHRDYLPDGKIWENAPIVGPLVKFQRETYVGCMLSPGGCADLLGAPK